MAMKGATVRVLLVALALLVCVSAGTGYCQEGKGGKEQPALDVPYEPTSYAIAKAMLDMAKVTSTDLVYDLGCGDGRIVIMAAKERGATGVGVDMDPARIKESRQNAKEAGVTERVRFFEQNLFDTDISNATVVMLYLWPEVNLRLRPKLLRDLKPGTRIVSHSHTMGEWEDDETRTVEKHNLHFFIVPANASGTWQWNGPDGQLTTLKVAQKFQQVKGTLSTGETTVPIMNVSLRGNLLRFSAETMIRGRKTPLYFEGRVSGDTIQGMMRLATGGRAGRWTTKRDPVTRANIAE